MTLPARAVASCTGASRFDDFSAGLAGAVGIVAAERLVLPIGPKPFTILIALVGRDHDDGANAPDPSAAFEHARRADDVRLERFDGRQVRRPNERLRRQMQHDIGLRRSHRGVERLLVAYISNNALRRPRKACQRREARLRFRRPRIACDARPEARQPSPQPAALEAGVASQEYRLAAPERAPGHDAAPPNCR